MAEENKDPTKQEDAKKEPTNVASLSIPTIIAALHQNAMKNANPASKGMVLTNTALEGDGKDAKLGSAGEHIISVRPDKDGGIVQKADAIKVLQTYVQWFVGPDLAKKVDDKTVVSLTEAPGTEGKKKNESAKFMSFGQFLLEETAPEEDDADDATEEEDEDAASEEVDADATEEDDTKGAKDAGDGDDASEEGDREGRAAGGEETTDESKESKAGYYIAYNLKVEGLPQTALKDSMKKYAKNFFDDVTFTTSGLFGGGKSFTVKDVKDAWKSAFGPIDPDKLVQNVEDRIQKKFAGSGHVDSIKVQDTQTLLNDLGSYVDPQQKKKISNVENALFIKLSYDDPKKKIFNPRVIADIVTSSISGLWKKFKNNLTKDDVILIQGYKDTHERTDQVRKTYHNVPTPDDLQTDIKKSKNASDAYSKIEKRIDKIAKDKNRKDCKRADACFNVWNKFKKRWEDNGDTSETRLKQKSKDYFQDFMKEYEKAFKDTEDKSLNESLFAVKQLNAFILESLFDGHARSIFNVPSNFTPSKQMLKHDIMSILLEDDVVDSTDENIEEEGDEEGGESTNSEESSSSEESSGESNEELGSFGNDNENDDNKKDDLYIVLMPNLKHEDPEYANNDV